MAEEVSQDGLVKGVFYEADYIIDVRGLDSGGSRDVHGQVLAYYKYGKKRSLGFCN
jgi:hypothetical protein